MIYTTYLFLVYGYTIVLIFFVLIFSFWLVELFIDSVEKKQKEQITEDINIFFSQQLPPNTAIRRKK